MTERLTHIDNAKAIGMMLIIASHVIPAEPVTKSVAYTMWNGVLNSFYVPLFFMLSGIFEPTDVDKGKLRRRICKLLKYCLYFYFFGIITDGFFYGNWTLLAFRYQTPIWFLIVLLWITIFVGVFKGLKNRVWIFLLLVLGG